METQYIISGIIGLILLFIFGNWVVAVIIKEQTKRAWKDFEEQLLRKIIIATEIIKEVMKYASCSKDLAVEIINAKNKAETAKTFKEKKEAGNALTMVLDSVFKVVEKYPDLKASVRLTELKKELEDIEEGFDSARKIYSDIIDSFRNIISKITSFFAKKEEAPVDEKPKRGKVKVSKKAKKK